MSLFVLSLFLHCLADLHLISPTYTDGSTRFYIGEIPTCILGDAEKDAIGRRAHDRVKVGTENAFGTVLPHCLTSFSLRPLLWVVPNCKTEGWARNNALPLSLRTENAFHNFRRPLAVNYNREIRETGRERKRSFFLCYDTLNRICHKNLCMLG